MGGTPILRLASKKAGPVVTDNGNFVIDVDFGQIDDPVKLNLELSMIVGVVETGLFCGLVDACYFGMEDGQVTMQVK
jgi:ribose 5-phosphate isomerase A